MRFTATNFNNLNIMEENNFNEIFNMKIFPITLNFWKDNIEYLYSIKEQLFDAKSSFSQQKISAIEDYKAKIKSNPELSYDFDLDLSNDFYQIEKIYPEIVYNSLFIYSYSYFEICLKKLKELVEDHIVNKVEVINLKSQEHRNKPYTLKSKIYIEKATGIDLSEKQDLWDSLNIRRDVRNAIVHNASNAEDNENLCNYLKNNDNFVFDEKRKDFYIKNADFVFDFTSDSEEYLFFLFQQLDKLDKNMYE